MRKGAQKQQVGLVDSDAFPDHRNRYDFNIPSSTSTHHPEHGGEGVHTGIVSSNVFDRDLCG
jgi:hypothetical protein